MNVIDNQLYMSISLDQVIIYLETNGWKRVEHPNDRLLVYSGPDDDEGVPIKLTLPRDMNLQDASLRLAEAINVLSILQGQSAYKLVIEMEYKQTTQHRDMASSESQSELALDKAGGGSYDDIDLSLIESIAPQMALALDRAEWQEKAEQLQLMSVTDPLTGLLNRRYLIERLSEELKRSERYGYTMSFMMIDIDDFKLYNDRNGHQAGDLALEMTAQCLKSALRSADVAARYGGEEFGILLPQTNLEEANIIAERIRQLVERIRYPHGREQPLGHVTVSIGVATNTPELDKEEKIIAAADRALYHAKRLGKNSVQAYSDSNVPPNIIQPSEEKT
jgi:diguanylate cyclase (GGDEF)-like protein